MLPALFLQQTYDRNERKMNMKKRVLAFLMTLAMIFSLAACGGSGGSGGGKGKGSGGGGTATQGPTGSGGTGTSPYSTGPGTADGGYIQKVAAKIKSNTSFNVPASLEGNPPVIYDVELLPDGTLRNIRKRKSSGIAGFDEAVLRAIEKSAPYPKDRSGRVPSGFTLTHKPKG